MGVNADGYNEFGWDTSEIDAQIFNEEHTTCAWATQYIVPEFPATAIALGECGALTTCILGFNFQTTAPTQTTDRVCGGIVTQCTQGINYQIIPPTLTSNQVCSPVTQCLLNIT
jgi:hypothetical protein